MNTIELNEEIARIDADYKADLVAAVERYNALHPIQRWLIQQRNLLRLWIAERRGLI